MVKAIAALITSAVLISSPALAYERASPNVQPPQAYRRPGFSPIYYVSSAELQRICSRAHDAATFRLRPGDQFAECVIDGIGYVDDPCQYPWQAYARTLCHLRAHQAGWAGDHPSE